jgi:hypothetical protein
METNTKNTKTELLLGTSLEVLHRESREWLEAIAFWKDETIFFADLLAKKQAVISEYGKMLTSLDKVHKDLFDYLSEDIVAHEKYLSNLLRIERKGSESEYRAKHRKLKERIQVFTGDFKQFKRMVFGYVKKL